MIRRLIKGCLIQVLVVGSVLLVIIAIFLQLAGNTPFVQGRVDQLRTWWSGATTAVPRDAAEFAQPPVPESMKNVGETTKAFQNRINRTYSGAVEILEPTPEAPE